MQLNPVLTACLITSCCFLRLWMTLKLGVGRGFQFVLSFHFTLTMPVKVPKHRVKLLTVWVGMPCMGPLEGPAPLISGQKVTWCWLGRFKNPIEAKCALFVDAVLPHEPAFSLGPKGQTIRSIHYCPSQAGNIGERSAHLTNSPNAWVFYCMASFILQHQRMAMELNISLTLRQYN